MSRVVGYTLFTSSVYKDIFKSHEHLNNRVKTGYKSSVGVKFQNGEVRKSKRAEYSIFKYKCEGRIKASKFMPRDVLVNWRGQKGMKEREC